jgi:hypothetical protein
MNLIEARKAGHEGWVRSPAITKNGWVQLHITVMRTEDGFASRYVDTAALDAEDWEPKPKPKKLWEGELWLCEDGITANPRSLDDDAILTANGWRKIRVREVTP